jgi:diguanylate cyclase (GGDEF)-like protein
MISIKRYFNQTAAEAALRQVVALLIEKIGESAVEGNKEELAAFRDEIKQFGDGFSPDTKPENLLTVAGMAAQALTAYNKRVTWLMERQSNEVQTIVRMLQQTLLGITGENTRSGQQLRQIEHELEKSGAIKDLSTLKIHLSECLNSLHEETLKQKSEAESTIQKLRIEIESSQSRASNATGGELDTITGLPRRNDAISAIQQAIDGGKRQYAVVMVVDRVQLINARFGHKAGDNMLRTFKRHIEKQVQRSDRLFRWTGPAIVAILERAAQTAEVRLEVKRMLDGRLEETYAADGRSVLLPITATWSAIPLTSSAEAADAQIQTFIASQHSYE